MSLSLLSANVFYKKLLKLCPDDSDFQKKNILIGQKIPAVLLFLDGCVDSNALSEQVIKPLCAASVEGIELCDVIMSCSSALMTERTRDTDKLMSKLAFGNAILVAGRLNEAFVFEARPKTVRSVSEPTSENVMKGGKDCLTEQMKVNVSLIRSRLINPSLRVERLNVGKQSSTCISLVYLDGTVNPDCLSIARDRIGGLDIDCVASLGVIEEALREDGCLFPQVLITERPDRVCANINEGCVAIIVDGFPLALIAPVSILHHMSTADDYARHPLAAGAIRLLRYFLLLVATVLPAFYISVATYHQEMLPSQLATSIIRTRLSVPFNDMIEIIILLLAFEILAEAGLRMPQNIGQTVSIVGGLIVGDAAVNAKLISPVVVIVVAISVISSYTIPDQDFSNAVRLCRFALCLVCSVFGLPGLSLGMAFIVIYLCASRSLGVPYMAPVTVTSPSTRDSFIRRSFASDLERPRFLGTGNVTRRRNG